MPRKPKKPHPPKKKSSKKRKKAPPRRPDASLEASVGTIQKSSKGFAFLAFSGGELEDLFLPPRTASQYFHGDRVEIQFDEEGNVHQFKTLSHQAEAVFGRFSWNKGERDRRSKGKGGWVTYEKKNMQEKIAIPHPPKKIQEGDWVHIELQFNPEREVQGKILEVFGEDLSPSLDTDRIATEFGLVEEQPQNAVKEAESFQTAVTPDNVQSRKDLRDIPFVTIDGADARDFDDAVSVEKTSSGYTLWVAIADVSHFVKEESALDESAYERGTSVYFPDRAFHMLPSSLAENLCSLRPDEERLALTARIQFDSEGNPTSGTEMMDAVIRSHRRATYEEIEEEKEKNESRPEWDFFHHFKLFRLLKKKREQRGSIDFDFPEARIELDENQSPIEIGTRERLDAHRLIEEFMIAANEAATRWVVQHRWPFIFRTHEGPDSYSFEQFRKLAQSVGVKVPKQESANEVTPKEISKILHKLEGHSAYDLLSMALLRSMKQAIYSTDQSLHFGLASENYTHFTSPIRRYPDLLVHRVIKKILAKKKPSDRFAQHLHQAAQHCSQRERLAAEAERECIRLKQVRMAEKHLGQEFPGKISGMNRKGIFIQLMDPFIEGRVSKDDIEGDRFEFNEEKMILFGRRSKQTFKIGADVHAQIIRADLDKRVVEFKLVPAENSSSQPTRQK